MTNEEIMEHLLAIYGSLEKLTVAVKLLLEESIARDDAERNRYGHTIFDDMSEDIRTFFDGVPKHD